MYVVVRDWDGIPDARCLPEGAASDIDRVGMRTGKLLLSRLDYLCRIDLNGVKTSPPPKLGS